MIEDVELLRRYTTERSEEAFAELVRRHLGLVYGSALRRVNGNAALAEEVAQSVFARVAHEVSELEKRVASGVALAGWLYLATRNAAANVVRAEVRRVRREQEAFVMSELESGNAGGMAGTRDAEVWAQVRPELEGVMDELGSADRDAVLLRFFEGKAFGEIGTALRVSEDAARVRVNRALEKLRGLLAKRGVTSTAAALGGLLAGNAAVAAPVGMAASVTGVALAGGVALSVGAVGASGLGAGILSFMTTTKLVLSVAGVITALAVGTAVYQGSRVDELRADSAALAGERARHAAIEKRISEAEGRVRLVEEERAALRAKLDGLLAEKAKSGGAAAVSSYRSDIDAMNALYEQPGYQEASLAKFRTSVRFTYAPFYRKMGMSAEKIAVFEAALAEREQAMLDKNAAARSQNISVTDPLLGKVSDPAEEGFNKTLRETLGDTWEKDLKAFEKSIGARSETSRMLASSQYSDAPLTIDQSEQIAELMLPNRLSRKNDGITTYLGYDWSIITQKAEEILPKAQAAFVRDYAAKMDAQQTWEAHWRAAREGKSLSEVTATKTK